jgi:hypothetical protein
MTMRILILLFLLLNSIFSFAQTPCNQVLIACGNHYFSEDDDFNNAALVVRGVFCGDSYIWTPISEGDTLQEVAYKDGEPFTGVCIDLDTNQVLIGRYEFTDGYIKKLEEFHSNGQVYKTLNYTRGIPNGPAFRITPHGLLDSFFSFDMGKRSGFYYITRDRTDWGLPPCIELGELVNGMNTQLTKPCFSDIEGE